MKKALTLLASMTAALLVAAPLSAAAISLDQWYGFQFTGPGTNVATTGGAVSATVTNIANPGATPWTITTAAPSFVVITDGFLNGDTFELFNSAVSLGSTSTPGSANGASTACLGGNDPLTCLVDGNYSSRVYAIGAGSYSFTIEADNSPFDGGGGAWFAVLSSDPTAVPEPGTWMMLAAGLGGIAFLRRR